MAARRAGSPFTIRQLTADAAEQFERAGIENPVGDAETLLAFVLGESAGSTDSSGVLSVDLRDRYVSLARRREQREPLEHLTGEARFRGLRLNVGPGVYVPRRETETLISLAIAAIADMRLGSPLLRMHAADLCTGSGVIPLAIAIEAGHMTVHAVERETRALQWAAMNVGLARAQLADAASAVELVQGDAGSVAAVGHPWHSLTGALDLVVCNPPYIPEGAQAQVPEVRLHDPQTAIFAGSDGLDVVRGAICTAAALLRPGGMFFVEHGDYQGEAGGERGVPSLLRANPAFTDVRDYLDHAGLPCVTAARRL